MLTTLWSLDKIYWVFIMYICRWNMLFSDDHLQLFSDYGCLLSLFWAAHSFYTTSLGKGLKPDGIYRFCSCMQRCPATVSTSLFLCFQVDRTPLPLLFMRTVIQAIDAFPTLVNSVASHWLTWAWKCLMGLILIIFYNMESFIIQ